MISVVIPCYRRKECILNLLRDVHAQVGVDFEVIVVDDCSPDDTAEAVRREFPGITLLVNPENGGPCVSRNRGIRAARGEWIIGLDSDVTLPDPHLFERFLSTCEAHPGVTGIAFRLLKPDGISEDRGRWWHPVPIGKFAGRHFMTSYFSGTAYAFRRDDVIEAGLYPEVLYMHYEEVELAFRILDGGGSILYCPDLRVLHHANEVSRRGEIEVYYKPRNQVLLAISTYPLLPAVRYLAPRLIYQFLVAAKGRHLADFRRAMGDATRKSREIARNRRPLKSETWKKISQLRKGVIA